MGKLDTHHRGNIFEFEKKDELITESFNINVAWLAAIYKLMVVFIDAKFQNDFEAMFESVDSLAMCLYPKMGNENRKIISDWLDWMENNKDKWCVRDNMGNIKRIHPENRKIIRKTFTLIFKELITYMEEVGLLTKEKKDPRLALGNITG